MFFFFVDDIWWFFHCKQNWQQFLMGRHLFHTAHFFSIKIYSRIEKNCQQKSKQGNSGSSLATTRPSYYGGVDGWGVGEVIFFTFLAFSILFGGISQTVHKIVDRLPLPKKSKSTTFTDNSGSNPASKSTLSDHRVFFRLLKFDHLTDKTNR